MQLPTILSRNSTPVRREPPPPFASPQRRRPIGEITTRWARDFVDGVRQFRKTFWPSAPVYAGTRLSYTAARALYRNDDRKANLGAGFARRIINSSVDFMDLPRSASGDEIVDEFLNRGIFVYWTDALLQMFRDTMRDAETVVRVRRHDPDNPLVSTDEWEACYLEIIPPESVAIYYQENGDQSEIEVAYVRHEIDVVEDPASDTGSSLSQPRVRQHVIIEEITPSRFRYYDETEGKWREDLEEPNSWGFVPLVEVSNEYDAVIEGGQSDLEAALPFIMAFHDVLGQALIAHKAHSIPKAKFRVHDMLTFIANNWPDAFDRGEDGRPDLSTFSGNISWKGTEILFMDAEEDVDFLQVQSQLGDSKTLLDFLLTCIAIASETPKSVLMDQTAQDADEMIPLAKKMNRKRGYFQRPIQSVCKMVLAINHMEPWVVPLHWEEITPDIALKKAQALEQNVMSMEVMATRQVISDRTMRESIRGQVPHMKGPQAEAQDAKKNVVPEIPATSSSSAAGKDAGNSKTAGRSN